MMFKANALRISTVRTEDDHDVSRRLLEMWTNFATHHNPTPKDGLWTRLDPENPLFLEIGSKQSVMKYPKEYQERMEEWRDIWRRIPPLMSPRLSDTWSELE